MADFHQNGVITTLHDFRRRSTEDLEADLRQFAQRRPMALVLPALYSELERPALANIVEQLKGADYISNVVIGLDRAHEDQFRHAQEYFSVLPQRHTILWNDGPRLKAIHEELEAQGLAPQEPGKGRNVWYCYGYVLADRRSEVIGLHDCDITTYDRSMLAKLMYPVANPAFRYMFAKGFYPRLTDEKLNGRVVRLLVRPLLIALRKTIGWRETLEYFEAFRYPLSGEFAIRAAILGDMRIPSDWGLEIGVLAEVRRHLSPRAICQVDIADRYDHKHQPLSEEDATAGLSRMSIDICKALIRKLALEGEVFHDETFRTLKATYLRVALDMIDLYEADARMNGLSLDRHAEEKAVELFAGNLLEAGKIFLEAPNEAAYIPSWNRVNSAAPDLLDRMHAAVTADNA
ncbi:glycosyl transferase [Rhodovulum sp. DZ06]|uniref:glycosyl transferase n=1 Tax=Rhodovulum sp. DZ06 TaxID=3425126 RepID=UPI003D34D811